LRPARRALARTNCTAFWKFSTSRVVLGAPHSRGNAGRQACAHGRQRQDRGVDETYIGRLRARIKTPWWAAHQEHRSYARRARRLCAQLPYRQHVDCGHCADPAENIRRESKPDDGRSAALHGSRRDYASHDAVNHGEEEYVRYGTKSRTRLRTKARCRSPRTRLKATIRSSSAA
jgi:hypothetical protein